MQKEIFSVNVEQVPQVLNVNLVNKLCDLKKKINFFQIYYFQVLPTAQPAPETQAPCDNPAPSTPATTTGTFNYLVI